MEKVGFFKILIIYFAVAGLILASNLFSIENIGDASVVPTLLSVLLLIPLWIWHRNQRQKASLSKQVQDEPKRSILFWILTFYILAMIIRIPSVLLFANPYEKTPLIYLLVLSIVVLMKTDLSIFGFKTSKFGRALLLGSVYFLFFSLLPQILTGAAFYMLKGQMLIEGFNPLLFAFAMPFMTLCVGISEEGLFRGYMQTRLSRVFSSRKGIFLQALLFGLWHFIWRVSPLDWLGMLIYVGNTFVIGLLFGYFYSAAANITPLVLAHGLNNSVLQGFIESPSALATFERLPMFTQLLFSLAPYILAWMVTFALTKLLIKTIMKRND